MQIQIINGPNLNLLGKREPEIYGSISFEQYFDGLKKRYPGLRLSYFQSNHEGLIVDKIQEIGFEMGGIVLNAGALSHYSHAIADAVKCVPCPVIEVHISNIHQREAFRHQSVLTASCKGIVSGFGLGSYDMALHCFDAEL